MQRPHVNTIENYRPFLLCSIEGTLTCGMCVCGFLLCRYDGNIYPAYMNRVLAAEGSTRGNVPYASSISRLFTGEELMKAAAEKAAITPRTDEEELAMAVKPVDGRVAI